MNRSFAAFGILVLAIGSSGCVGSSAPPAIGTDFAGDSSPDPDATEDASLPEATADDVPGADGDASSDTSGGCAVDATPGPGVVVTDRGAVQGVPAGAVWAYRGIPYASPPLGDLRWRPPAPAACWPGIRDASEFGSACPQIDAKGEVTGEEDCLTLNVWTPGDAAPAKPVPVMFFIHGGGNIQGSSRETILGNKPIYDGRRLAGKGVVVVTVNYRLGPFGFLALPELSAESSQASSGNYGVLDQLAALAWVRDNIAAFGGDPGRVMVFGESAGAVDTCTLVASPLAKGLFHAALMESGGCSQPTLAPAEQAMGDRVAKGSCGTSAGRLACLRGLPMEKVMAELPGSIGVGDPTLTLDPAKYGPVVDGWVLAESPLDAMAAGRHNRVPFVVGTNAEELASLLTVKITTEAQFENLVGTTLAPLGQATVDKVLSAYPVSDYASPQDALVALYSDMRFTCPARQIARAAVAGGTPDVRRYFFARRAPTPQGPKPAQHGIELLYVFGTASDIPGYVPAAADLALADAMMGYWSRFAGTGDPDGGGAVAWPAYEAASDPFLRLDDPIAEGHGVRTPQCDLFDEIVASIALP